MARSTSSFVALGPVMTMVLGTVLLAAAFAVVFIIRIGGVIVTLTSERGIHSGDLGAVPVALIGAALLVAPFRPQAARHSERRKAAPRPRWVA